jgi:hypothetical protein
MTQNHSGAAYCRTFVVCLVLISVPIKNFAYLVPLAYLALEFFFGNARTTLRTIGLGCIVLCVSAFSLLVDVFRGHEVNLPGLAMAGLTYLPLLIIFAERFNKKIDDATFDKILVVCAWFVIIQSTIGVLQYLASGNADAVCGTFGLLDFRHNTITIAQVYFTFTMFGMVLFLLLSPGRPLTQLSILFGLIACALAQSGHQTIFFLASFAFCGAIRFWRPKVFLTATTMVVITYFSVIYFYPHTIEQSAEWYRKTVLSNDSPKRLATTGGMEVVDDTKNLLLGAGAGQYSSRAALITSNEYLNVKLPPVLSGESDYAGDHLPVAKAIFEESGEGSAISKPYYSLLSVFVEFGLIQTLVLAGVFLASLFRNLQLMRSPHPQVAAIGMFSSVGILFFLLCCTIENYMEFPQAIFIPMILYVIALSRASYNVSSQGEA